MNKILSYTFVACAAVATMASCQLEEENIFETSAAERLNEASDVFSQRLIDGQDGWAIEYYAQPETSLDTYVKGVGYLMLAKFEADKSVRIGMNNDFTDKKYDEDVSAWQVINDMGAVLSFNTYNRMLHTFSLPEDVKGTSDDETGKGFLGDYEFVMVDVPEGGDYVMLKGKKHKAYSRMTRLSPGTDFQEYISDVQRTQQRLLSNSAPNHLVMTVGEKQYNFLMPSKGGELGLTKFWPAGTDSTFTMTLNPLLMTRHVAGADTTYTIRFRDQIVDEEQDLTAQEFVYVPATSSFKGVNDETMTIVGQDPVDFFGEVWPIGSKFVFKTNMDGTDKAKELMNNLINGYKDIKYSFQNAQLSKTDEGAEFVISYKTNKNASGKVTYKYSASQSDSQLKLAFTGAANDAAEKQMASITAIKDFVNALNGSFTIGVGNNPLNLTTLSFAKDGDSSLIFIPSYQK